MNDKHELENRTSKKMLEDKFRKLDRRIFLRESGKLLYHLLMSTRSTILRICPSQSLISGWLRL
jgi:hypothetical protein